MADLVLKQEKNAKGIKEYISIKKPVTDYDSDSDDGFDVVKKKENENPLHDQIECIHDILETILAIPSFNSTFIDHIKSHNDLFTDLLKTHITTTNDIHLLSLLYICVDLLIKTKSEIGLLCFNRITTLSLGYDSGFNTNDNEKNDGYCINRKSLRLLTKMVYVYGSHLLSLIHRPLNVHLNGISIDYEDINSENELLRSGSILQIAKLYEMEEHRKMIDEWKYKDKLYDIIKDRDNDNNMDISIIQNALITLHEMAHHNKYKSIRKYCSISCKVSMIICDKLLNIVNNKKECNTFGIDVILDSLSCDLLNHHLSIAYIFSVSQQLKAFIKDKVSMINYKYISNIMSAIKALIKCLRIIEDKTKHKMNANEIEEYISCISYGLVHVVRCCRRNDKYELLWCILNDILIILSKYPLICTHWTSQEVISTFGLIFNDRNYVKKSKLNILCAIIESIYKYDMKQCLVIITALNSYLMDVVDQEIINQIMQNIQNTIYNLLQKDASMDIINSLFGLISSNTLTFLSSSQIFIIKYSYFVSIIKNILIRFKQYELDSSFPFLCLDYHIKLVQNLVSFYLSYVSVIHNDYFVQSIIYLTAEFCQYLKNEQIFNVFNYILPTFLNETSFIQLSIITAITKIYLKINNESRTKILPLLQHIFDLCNHDINLDVRCRATMYQRLIKYDINAAKQIVLNTQKAHRIRNEDDDIKSVNDKIDHDLCRLSGIYDKEEKEFVDDTYLRLEESESEYYSEEEESINTTEYHSSDNEYNEYNDYELVVDSKLGQGLEIAIRVDINSKHNLKCLITNRTEYDIYQIDMKFNKNYIGVQSLKTLLSNNEIIGVNKSKKITIPLKLIQKSHENKGINTGLDDTKIETAIRYFQQRFDDKEKNKLLSHKSSVIFFYISIPCFLFFNEFRANTANNKYLDAVSQMQSISRKCEMNIAIKDNDDTELMIHNIITHCIQCKKIKELKQKNKKKIIYMALLQFKWVLIGICIHENTKHVIIDIITKSNKEWISEAAMQCVKFAILSHKTFHLNH